eukprot:2035856-Ditylum_brightwellii.AAC.1
MRFHWLKCREAQKQFIIKWKRGTVNRADYHSKHHPPIHHQQQGEQDVVNAAVAADNKNVMENIHNVMRCMHAVVLNQVSVRGGAEALLRHTKRDTRVGANTTAQTTARQQITPKPGSVPIAHMCAQHTYVSNKTNSIGSKVANAP